MSIFDFWKKGSKQKQKAYVPPISLPSGVDLYEVLGVSPSAGDDEIRHAFRKMARKYHPDTNPNDPNAARRYLEISRANDILTDPDHRRAYDRIRAGSQRSEAKRYPAVILPRAQEGPEMPAPKKEGPRKRIPKPIDWDVLFDAPSTSRRNEGSFFDFVEPSSPGQSIGPAWGKMFPSAVKVTVPSTDKILEAVGKLPLKDIWGLVRKNRTDPGFLAAQSMYVGPFAGHGGNPVEAEIAHMVGIPLEEIHYYAERKGLHRLWENVLGPLSESLVLALESLKPSDLPGAFYVDWGQSGQLDLYYAEVE